MKGKVDYDEEGYAIPLERYNILQDNAVRDTDGFWEVIRVARQVISYDGEDFYAREISFKAIDRDLRNASSTTMNAVIGLLREYDDDFWSKEEWEGKQYLLNADGSTKKLEEKENDLSEDISDK